MAKRFYKHKLLLDENFSLRSSLPLLNKRYDVKHSAMDYKQSGLSDPQVYELACKEERLLVTYNVKDFELLASKSDKTGIIGVSPNLSLEQTDKKLTALLARSTKKALLGKLTVVSGEGII